MAIDGLSFEIVEGRDKGKILPIPADGCSVGRKGAIKIDDKKAEDFHAQLEHVNGNIVLRDLATSAGTLVNGRKVHEAALNVADVITIGSTRLAVVRKAAPVEHPTTPPATPTPTPQQDKPTGEWFYKQHASTTEIGPVSAAS